MNFFDGGKLVSAAGPKQFLKSLSRQNMQIWGVSLLDMWIFAILRSSSQSLHD